MVNVCNKTEMADYFILHEKHFLTTVDFFMSFNVHTFRGECLSLRLINRVVDIQLNQKKGEAIYLALVDLHIKSITNGEL